MDSQRSPAEWIIPWSRTIDRSRSPNRSNLAVNLSIAIWGGLRVSVAPAAEWHPYGYRKAEALSGIVASLAVLAAAAMIAVQAIREILTPNHLPYWSALLVLVVVVATTAVLARWMGDIGENADSSMLQADTWHHWVDALTSLAALIGITIGLIGCPCVPRPARLAAPRGRCGCRRPTG